MTIQTVRDNLKNTIAGKEKMLTTLQARVGLERAGIDQVAFIATVNFLEINIAELQRVLQDVEQCAKQASDDSWITNPDRMGGCYSEDELKESGWK